MTARRKAERAARAMVATAAEIRETIRPREGTIMVNRSIAEAMREAAVKAEAVLLEHERGVFHDRDDARDRTRFSDQAGEHRPRPQDPVPGRRRAPGRLHRLDAPERDDLGRARRCARRGRQVR